MNGDGVSGANAGTNAITARSTGNSDINVVLINAGSFAGAQDNGVDFHVDSGSFNLSIAGADGTNVASFDDAMGGSAIVGVVENNANTTLNLSNFSADRSADVGLELTADDDSTITGMVQNGSFNGNASNGIQLTTNPDMSLNDNSLIDLDFDDVTADMNFGDGLNATVFNGNDMAGAPQMTGIIIDYTDGSLSFNSNMNPGDGIGFGFSGTADGDGSGPQNTRITFDVMGTDILGNEEGAINEDEMDGGSVD